MLPCGHYLLPSSLERSRKKTTTLRESKSQMLKIPIDFLVIPLFSNNFKHLELAREFSKSFSERSLAFCA